jgi:hypothetical protein
VLASKPNVATREITLSNTVIIFSKLEGWGLKKQKEKTIKYLKK